MRRNLHYLLTLLLLASATPWITGCAVSEDELSRIVKDLDSDDEAARYDAAKESGILCRAGRHRIFPRSRRVWATRRIACDTDVRSCFPKWASRRLRRFPTLPRR